MAKIIKMHRRAAKFILETLQDAEHKDCFKFDKAETIVLMVQYKDGDDTVTSIDYSIENHAELVYALEYIKNRILSDSEIVFDKGENNG